MDKQIIGMITLLRSALKNEALALPKDFDLHSACRILYEHHLTGLAVRGATRCGVSVTAPELRGLTAEMCKSIEVSRAQARQLERVYALFEANGIEYVTLKGGVLKALYPQPELRIMGDADVLIRLEQYPAIRTLLPSIGMKEEVESDYEYVWSGSGLKLELHKRLIPTHNRDYYEYFGEGWDRVGKDENSSAYHLTTEDHFIYLLVHFAKHYRYGSVTAKNICDFWVYRNAYPEMDEAYIQEQMQKLEMTEFYRNVLQLLDTWFEGSTPTDATERMTEAVFRGGVRNSEEVQMVFGVLRQEQETGSFEKRKRRLIWRRIFPSAQALYSRYPLLKKCPILLPFFWVVRWITALFCRPGKAIDSMKNLKNMDESQIESYKEDLRAVGLDVKLTK